MGTCTLMMADLKKETKEKPRACLRYSTVFLVPIQFQSPVTFNWVYPWNSIESSNQDSSFLFISFVAYALVLFATQGNLLSAILLLFFLLSFQTSFTIYILINEHSLASVNLSGCAEYSRVLFCPSPFQDIFRSCVIVLGGS